MKFILKFLDWLSKYDFESLKLRRIQCNVFGHPLEWTYFCKVNENRGYYAWCRVCGIPIDKYAKMHSFKRHSRQHGTGVWNCEISKEKG